MGKQGLSREEFERVKAEAAVAERARCKTIFCCPEAEGRESLARHLALKTEYSAEEAIAILRASPASPGAKLATNEPFRLLNEAAGRAGGVAEEKHSGGDEECAASIVSNYLGKGN